MSGRNCLKENCRAKKAKFLSTNFAAFMEFSLTPWLQPGDWRRRKVLTVSTVCCVHETVKTVLSFTAQVHPAKAGC
jgi:hypothetical protein